MVGIVSCEELKRNKAVYLELANAIYFMLKILIIRPHDVVAWRKLRSTSSILALVTEGTSLSIKQHSLSHPASIIVIHVPQYRIPQRNCGIGISNSHGLTNVGDVSSNSVIDYPGTLVSRRPLGRRFARWELIIHLLWPTEYTESGGIDVIVYGITLIAVGQNGKSVAFMDLLRCVHCLFAQYGIGPVEETALAIFALIIERSVGPRKPLRYVGYSSLRYAFVVVSKVAIITYCRC